MSGSTFDLVPSCGLCAGTGLPADAGRYVWDDGVWTLWTSTRGSVPGFSILMPKRHVPHITDLAGMEAATFGDVLGRSTRALREATGSAVVYVYVFGEGIAHLHVHLAPHRPGDALNSAMLRGRVTEEPLPSGATVIRSLDFPERPASELSGTADAIGKLLAGASP
ncbi:MAG: adenylyltransferase [Chloroflexota bacterium]|nr:adenylyltransferase [Chloroflexota bacterium]